MNRFAPAASQKNHKRYRKLYPWNSLPWLFLPQGNNFSQLRVAFRKLGLCRSSLILEDVITLQHDMLAQSMATDLPVGLCWAVLPSWGHGAQSSIFWWGSLHASWDPYGSREFRFLKFLISNASSAASARFSLYPCLKLFRAPTSWLDVISILRRASRRCWRWSPWIIWSGMSLWRISPVQVRDLACFNGNLTASVCHFF